MMSSRSPFYQGKATSGTSQVDSGSVKGGKMSSQFWSYQEKARQFRFLYESSQLFCRFWQENNKSNPFIVCPCPSRLSARRGWAYSRDFRSDDSGKLNLIVTFIPFYQETRAVLCLTISGKGTGMESTRTRPIRTDHHFWTDFSKRSKTLEKIWSSAGYCFHRILFSRLRYLCMMLRYATLGIPKMKPCYAGCLDSLQQCHLSILNYLFVTSTSLIILFFSETLDILAILHILVTVCWFHKTLMVPILVMLGSKLQYQKFFVFPGLSTTIRLTSIFKPSIIHVNLVETSFYCKVLIHFVLLHSSEIISSFCFSLIFNVFTNLW